MVPTFDFCLIFLFVFVVFYSPVSPLCFAVKGLGLPLIILICVH